ncbi:unnamed protein product, partial [Staurois parvus]
THKALLNYERHSIRTVHGTSQLPHSFIGTTICSRGLSGTLAVGLDLSTAPTQLYRNNISLTGTQLDFGCRAWLQHSSHTAF